MLTWSLIRAVTVALGAIGVLAVLAHPPAFAATNSLAGATEIAAPQSAPGTNDAVAAATTTNTLGVVSMDSLDDTMKLNKGDMVSYRVIEDREEPRPITITELGELEVPYAGRYVALNKTCKQLAQELKVFLEKDLYYKATVIITLDYQNKGRDKEFSRRVTVVGEVRAPGVQIIPSDDVLTVSRAILGAGGFGAFANKRRVKISRPNPANTNEMKVIEVDLTEIWDKGKTYKDEKLEPGDLVSVPSTPFRFK